MSVQRAPMMVLENQVIVRSSCFGEWEFHMTVMMKGKCMAWSNSFCLRPDFSSPLNWVYTSHWTISSGGRLWVPYKDRSFRRDWSFILVQTASFTNQMAKKGQSQLSIQKHGCSQWERLWDGRPAGQLTMDSPHPISPEVSLWPVLDNPSAIWDVVSIHPDTHDQRAAEMAGCGGFGDRKPPGTCPVIYFWLFWFGLFLNLTKWGWRKFWNLFSSARSVSPSIILFILRFFSEKSPV